MYLGKASSEQPWAANDVNHYTVGAKLKLTAGLAIATSRIF